MHLKNRIRQAGQVTIVDLEGRIVIGPDNDALNDFLQALVQQKVRKLLINLANVTQLDSSGISSLVRAYTTMLHAGGSLALLHPGGHVREVLDLTRLSATIPTFDDEEQAVARLASAKASGRSAP